MDATAIVYDDRSRHIPLPVQREGWARHRGKCAVPGCCNRLFLQFHHLDAWAEGGTHDPKRLTLLCTQHHQAVHDEAMTVEGAVETGLRFVATRAAPPPPSTWDLTESGLRNI